ncbi:MAG: hypothetical protein HY928_16090 [Elusimicrobia bacterium]|nr:hypothetical protein [Elusimicrobiota bacterium]
MSKTAFAPRGDWALDAGPDGPRVAIPTRPVWFVSAFLLVWLGGWSAGEASALGQVFGNAPLFVKAFLLFWLAGWTAGGLADVLVSRFGLRRAD